MIVASGLVGTTGWIAEVASVEAVTRSLLDELSTGVADAVSAGEVVEVGSISVACSVVA